MSLRWEDVILGDPFDPQGTENAARGVISQVFADGTVSLNYKGGTANRVRILSSSYAPRTGDMVEVVRRNAATLLVLGPLRTENLTSVEVHSSLGILYNIDPALIVLSPTPEQPAGPNPLYVNPVSTASFRGGDWERDQVYQGAYSPQYGWWKGLYFYGSQPQVLAGRRVVSFSIRIARATVGGPVNNAPQYLAPHVHEGQPGGSPLFTAGAYHAGNANRNEPVRMTLPVEWGQALVDGQVRGFGHIFDSTSAYSIAKSKGEDAETGQLEIGWA